MSDLFNNTVYLNSPDNKYRYALGTKGKNTLYCFGINPSTATPESPDPTIRRVKGVAKKMGFDSYVMLNIYPIRATNPRDLYLVFMNPDIHSNNLRVIEDVVKDGSTVWAAWGDWIQIRAYLKKCLTDIMALLKAKGCHWVKMGELTQNGNPRHPLYLKYQSFSEYKGSMRNEP